jgi:hypothetical protein
LFNLDEWTCRKCDSYTGEEYDLNITNDCNIHDIMVNKWLKVSGNTIQVQCFIKNEPSAGFKSADGSKVKNYHSLRFKKGVQPSYNSEALVVYLSEINYKERYYSQRFYLDFESNKYEVLQLKLDITKIRARYLFDIPPPKNKKFILLPFLFCSQTSLITATPTQIDALCKWVQPHLEIPASLEEIRKAYEELIRYIDYDIMQPSPHWETWKNARGIS